MESSLILYGSRARLDARRGSDTDLILANNGDALDAPSEFNGISVHRYSKGWLAKEAAAGNLFTYHVAFEGVPLVDVDNFLESLRKAFKPKASYAADAATSLLILKMLTENNWKDNREAIRRFFWAIRTFLIATSMDAGDPTFSSLGLEKFSKLEGLSQLINNREAATFAQCAEISQRLFSRFRKPSNFQLEGDALREHLIDLGGIAFSSVAIVEQSEALAVSVGIYS